MGHTPFGYRIVNGKAVVDAANAEKLQNLYKNYLSGMSLETAAKEAGIDTFHGTVTRMMSNRHYLGDDYYPAIIDVNTFTEAILEREKRAEALKKTGSKENPKRKIAPTRFRIGEIKDFYENPAEQAEYLYRLIERED